MVTIKMLKSPAKGSDKRFGSLVVNPGGPGGSGYEFAIRQRTISPAVMAQYDVVGFDPRELKAQHLIKCLDGPETDKFISHPRSPCQREQQRRLSKCRVKGLEYQLPGKSPALSPAQLGRLQRLVISTSFGICSARATQLPGISYGTFLGLTRMPTCSATASASSSPMA